MEQTRCECGVMALFFFLFLGCKAAHHLTLERVFRKKKSMRVCLLCEKREKTEGAAAKKKTKQLKSLFTTESLTRVQTCLDLWMIDSDSH